MVVVPSLSVTVPLGHSGEPLLTVMNKVKGLFGPLGFLEEVMVVVVGATCTIWTLGAEALTLNCNEP